MLCYNQNMAIESKKTAKMLGVEKKFKRELEKIIPELVNELELTGAANQLGVGKATLSYWMLKLGIQFRKVALAPGENIEIKRLSD